MTDSDTSSPAPREDLAVFSLKFSIEKILSPDFGRVPSRDLRLDDDSSRSSTQSPTENSRGSQSNLKIPYAWIYATRFSDRPSAGPRTRRIKKKEKKPDEKRPRTAFTADQLTRLKQEFQENKYLTEKRRQDLAKELCLNESQIKIWFQNKRAKIKKAGQPNPLALQLMAQGLYNHSTVAVRDEEES